MAKRGPLGNLGRKNPAPAAQVGLREGEHAARVDAFGATVAALRSLNKEERTNTLAAVAEFFGLSLSVEN